MCVNQSSEGTMPLISMNFAPIVPLIVYYFVVKKCHLILWINIFVLCVQKLKYHVAISAARLYNEAPRTSIAKQSVG